MIPAGLLLAWVGGVPLPIAMIAWLPMVPMAAMTVFEAVALHDFGREYGFRIGPWQYVKLTVGGPLYAVVLAAAALRAVWREYTGRRDWELTSHIGAHLSTAPQQRQQQEVR
ncbi:hypothetical protein [Streptomyces spiramyceticus]|uniref:hypothetical protein n=1 Tax=Streptomyces spiramyceticus TaxID=299717 RepID=UPI00237A90AB|nr:hypothetical protein [Streptomyces spiramyceticus]